MKRTRKVQATRYVTPLREGGSLPAVVEADDGELYVMKFVGAGQGPKALIAELLGGQIARALGFQTPDLVFIEMDDQLGRSEPDPEIQDLLQASIGLNLGMRYLPSSLAYNPLVKPPLPADMASDIVWFDAYITNVDRTARNVNMLIWEQELWLIDHGAALYFHHDWGDFIERSRSPFSFTSQHTLLALASRLRESDQRLRPLLTNGLLSDIVATIPAVWFQDEEIFATPEANRKAYVDYLAARRDAADSFLEEAINAHKLL
jgi:hypothetical protein